MGSTNLNIGTGSGGVGVSVTTLLSQFTFNGGAEVVNHLLTNNNSPVYVQELALSDAASGWNAFSPPTKAGGVIILPQPEMTRQCTLKGITGDTGILLAMLAPSFIAFGSTPPGLGLSWPGKAYEDQAVTSVSDVNDNITYTAHGLLNGDRVMISPASTSVPGGLTAGIWYYIINKATDTFELSMTATGSKLDITSIGSSVKFTIAHKVKLIWV